MPDPIQILAIDPGEKVGWAHGEVVGSTLEVIDHGIMTLWGMADELDPEMGGYSSGDLRVTQFDVVIYETWRLSAAHAQELIGSDMQTSQLIGVIRHLARKHDVKLVSQGPKDWHVGKTVAPHCVTEILATLPKSHDESHDGPALCHLAKYWFTHYFDPTQEPA